MTELAAIVSEIERHLAEAGWDQPARLYALVPTRDLLATDPQLADLIGANDPDGLTPVEQEPIDGDVGKFLAGIEWPPAVSGCAFVNEVFLLPDGEVTATPEEHPGRRDVRLAVAVLRGGGTASLLRIRGNDGEADDVLSGDDLVPNLAQALHATFPDDQRS